jgi:hypothetical protein
MSDRIEIRTFNGQYEVIVQIGWEQLTADGLRELAEELERFAKALDSLNGDLSDDN